MVAKVIGYGPTLEAARLRLIGALKETVLFGTPSNKDFLIQCLDKQSFIDGAATTAFIGEEFSAADLDAAPVSFLDSAVAATLDLWLENKAHFQRSILVSCELKNWTIASAMVSRKQYQFGDITHDLSISPINSSADTYHATDTAAKLGAVIQIISMQDNKAVVLFDGVKLVAQFMQRQRGQIYCSIQGRGAFFKEVMVSPGDKVVKGQTLAVLEAMKMHYEILAEVDGTVEEVSAVAGSQVAVDDVLIEIKEKDDS
jgi:geranyl-CoA carboxylase alpha subunit